MALKKRTWILIIIGVILLPPLLFSLTILTLYLKQDDLVQDQLSTVNENFNGRLEVRDSHISPFERFPHVSLEIDDLIIHEGKENEDTVLHIQKCYLGFDLWTILDGEYEVKDIELKGGYIDLIQDSAGNLNIAKAFESQEDTSKSEDFSIKINAIDLIDIDLEYQNEENDLLVKAAIETARSSINLVPNHIKFTLNSKFLLDVFQEGKPTIMVNKHFETRTELDYIEDEAVLLIKPSQFDLEHGVFGLVGKVDLDHDIDLDLVITGNKPNFDLLIAFAPEDLAETLRKYDNAGKIYFEAAIKGKMANGHTPYIRADFGCEEAFFRNNQNDKILDELFFKGHFTNGEQKNLSTTEFSLMDFSARPEAGKFKGHLIVKNFESPEIDMKLSSNFDLEFLAGFLNIRDLEDLDGDVSLTMNFRDIIDLNEPERSLEKFNQSYFTELDIKDLTFKSPDYHLRVDDIDLRATMEGNQAQIDYFNLKVGNSDLRMTASISDLPSILHHTDIPVTAKMQIQSDYLDITQLTTPTDTSKGVDEQIENFNLKMKFVSSAKAFTESPNLPTGDFYIEDLYAKFKHYPHTLHDFHADIKIEETSMRYSNLSGMIDSSDFRSTGSCMNYNLWFDEEKQGRTNIFFFIESNSIKFRNLFTYEGVNYVPEEYRHEEFRDFKFKGNARLKYDKELVSTDIFVDYVRAKMKIHPFKLERLGGRLQLANNELKLTNFRGKMGNSQFVADMTYYLGDLEIHRTIPNHLKFTSIYLNFDQLMKYRPPPPTNTSNTEAHEQAWSIYQIPFPNMSFDFKIDHMNYQKKVVKNFFTEIRTKDNQTLFLDTLSLEMVGGKIDMKGVFSGSNPRVIYFRPNIKIADLDLDQLLLRFENLGQDHLVSENVNGKLSGEITGNIRMYPNMVPKIDESDIEMKMRIVGGRLENYSALDALSEYFKDKNLAKVLFDTLQNSIQMKKGVMYIPNMTINSSLGFIEVSGQQDMDLNMEYYLRIPWKMVTKAGFHKLFKKNEDIPEDQIDDIEYKEEGKRTRYLNIKITGTPDDYSISMGKDKG